MPDSKKPQRRELFSNPIITAVLGAIAGAVAASAATFFLTQSLTQSLPPKQPKLYWKTQPTIEFEVGGKNLYIVPVEFYNQGDAPAKDLSIKVTFSSDAPAINAYNVRGDLQHVTIESVTGGRGKKSHGFAFDVYYPQDVGEILYLFQHTNAPQKPKVEFRSATVRGKEMDP